MLHAPLPGFPPRPPSCQLTWGLHTSDEKVTRECIRWLLQPTFVGVTPLQHHAGYLLKLNDEVVESLILQEWLAPQCSQEDIGSFLRRSTLSCLIPYFNMTSLEKQQLAAQQAPLPLHPTLRRLELPHTLLRYLISTWSVDSMREILCFVVHNYEALIASRPLRHCSADTQSVVVDDFHRLVDLHCVAGSNLSADRKVFLPDFYPARAHSLALWTRVQATVGGLRRDAVFVCQQHTDPEQAVVLCTPSLESRAKLQLGELLVVPLAQVRPHTGSRQFPLDRQIPHCRCLSMTLEMQMG